MIALTIVHPDLRPGRSGHDGAVYRLAVALAERPDVTLRVVTGTRPAPLPPGVVVVRLPCLPVWHLSLRFLSFLLAWSVYRRLRRPGPDEVVYLGSPLLGGGDLAAVHFLSLDWQTAAWSSPPPVNWRLRLRTWHDHLRHALAVPLECRAYRAAARGREPRLLPVSEGLAERLETRFGAIPGLTVVPNIIDTTRFHPAAEPDLDAAVRAAAGWPKHWPIVLFVGGAWQRKGLGVALRAMAALSAPAGLLVVGPGPQAALQAEAVRLGIAPRVHAVGLQADTAPFYRIAAALVLPSLYETDGLVAWEALASGVPVVAAPFAGSEAWLRGGVTGYAARGAEATAGALDRVLADSTLRDRCTAMSRDLVASRSPQVVAAQVVDLARQVRTREVWDQ